MTPERRSQRGAARHVDGRLRYGVLLGVLLLGLLLLGVTTLFVGIGRAAQSAQPDPSSKLEPALQEALDQAGHDQHLQVIVHMQPTAMQPPAQDVYADLPEETLARRATLVQRLQMAAGQSQADIQSLLQGREEAGQVSFQRTLWIVNAIQVRADREAISALAARPDVASVTLDDAIQLLDPVTDPTVAGDATLPWHLQRTRVQHVWAGLGISGTGSTIAVMDTGADWQHPALANNYRGLVDGGSPQHELAWFDAVEGSPEPFDPHGHGTHVIGTASGRLGIGVAPGSRWMAVRILNANGSGSIGDIHAGFQWLLAPNGDPALAPDIVNGSWSGSPELNDFMPDIEALRTAGIVPVFAAGNSGPEAATVRTPANYPGVIAVGATDDIDQIAWFSSRGPSLWTAEVKPTIAAPGVHVLSSLPGGAYGYNSGTSMASPHIAGIFALLLSADPGLDAAGVTAVLTSTAQPITAETPNDASGWGRADAYAAVASLTPSGRVVGQVTGAGQPLPAALITITTPANVALPYSPKADGSFSAPLISGTYGIAVSAFGYAPVAKTTISVKNGEETNYLVDLDRLAHGRVEGWLLDLDSGKPLSGTIRVSGAPTTATVGADGRYDFELPAGHYELVAWVRGHLLGRQEVAVTAGIPAVHDILLTPGPDVLLVDSGQWYGGSQRAAYDASLQANDFAYSTVIIRDPYRDVPTVELLSQFDIVVWSAPKDSPGYVGAGYAVSGYLDNGGSLLIGGQNVAIYDQGQPAPQRWWHDQLRGRYEGKSGAPFLLQGEPGTIFQEFALELLEQDSNGSPVAPDASSPGYGSLTQVGLRYSDGRAASLLAGQCNSFRIAYFGFGLEDVSDPQARSDLLASSFDYFAQPETEVGLLVGRKLTADLVPPGAQRSYPIQLLNLSELYTDTYHLSVSSAAWPSQIITDTIELGPCQGADTSLEVEIPAGLALDTREQIRVEARSSISPTYRQTMTFDLKTPGRILLVDDDRWYDQSAKFKAAMNTAGIPFDFWETGGISFDTSPPADLLLAYEFVLWYTGYDWFRPVTKAESESLAAYLAQGGRLFLTSQDYMYYHARDPLTRNYLGVIHYAESVTPTMVYAPAEPGPLSDIGGPYPLTLGPYQNNGDGLVPAPGAQVSLWHDAGYPAGVANAGPNWRTVFLGIPLETLPADVQAPVMSRVVGWLSDLGQSTFVVSDRSSLPGTALNYTLTLRYAATGPGTMASITNTLPASLTLDRSSLTGGAHYDPVLHRVTWSGALQPGQEHEITYRATPLPNLLPGDIIENKVEMYYSDHDLGFEQLARTWMAAPDLTRSQVTLQPGLVRPGQNVTVALTLRNDGLASPISASLRFPAEVRPLTATLQVASGETSWSDQRLNWRGWLQSGQVMTATIVMTTAVSPEADWLPLTAIVDDNSTPAFVVSSFLEVRPFIMYMPQAVLNNP